jgi:four helix bundle protein
MSGPIRSYQDLDVWQVAVTLAENCSRMTAHYPKDEAFGMSSQIRRSAVSIAANIAEGYGRDHTGQYIQFLRIAQGSARELETHLIIAERVGLPAPDPSRDPRPDCDRVGRMLRALIRSLESRKGDK